ncbi:hypothetical protein [Treponema putidum]|uniref:SH3 domain-containing protein n=1 Tax=Treponema putidum TaxID=221027 RepID=A0AAE9SH46_9SPIR|nr:hypothetical protein [Treponema putidum]AIN93781.1 hypothetical protein JO40_06365 [Treponema putidum]TWI77888.1 hypothetical protein JM98_01198 [Treponema putidum]UTY27728.1 hypothetical protein E4N76_01040 [Treponema putidum]UTY30184.1 hypothetical protein E4N75_00350 [Treponema putidum]UTY32640.1 hypothetical protein E4N74_00365 [Treponema putidum]
MKKSTIICLLMFFAVFGILTAEKSSKKMYVNIKETWIKSDAGFFAKNVMMVRYGEQVYLLEEKGKWMKVSPVSNPDLVGWLPTANLTRKKIVGSFDKKTSAEAKELALAGKGLTEGSGSEFSASGKKNYEAVDSVEAIKISQNDLQLFIKEGLLKDGE